MSQDTGLQKNLSLLAERTVEQAADLERIERIAIASYRGRMDELEAALGMLRIGHHFGWRVLVLIHNKRTLRKYEEILGINVREFFPEEGPSESRALGYQAVKKIGNFWKAVSGDIRIEDRREIGPTKGS